MSKCEHCSTALNPVYHWPQQCPKVKLIEYWPNGDIKRIEFYEQTWPIYPVCPSVPYVPQYPSPDWTYRPYQPHTPSWSVRTATTY